jgi:hypothetical protein
MIENLLVALIVAGAAVYSLWHLAPASVRQSAVSALARRCSRSRMRALMPGLQRAAAKPTGACAGCGARGQCPVGRKLG